MEKTPSVSQKNVETISSPSNKNKSMANRKPVDESRKSAILKQMTQDDSFSDRLSAELTKEIIKKDSEASLQKSTTMQAKRGSRFSDNS